ncbi:MAG: DUF192 domain-containing protein [Candidatus Pacebacteria bacterium]|nr:DUF192 domain-containing protein [Candidatus Paceibacterota bacterium]
MYQRPYTKEEILEKYPKEISDRLLGDRVHVWRAETGIELIHKEPTRKEQKRIWNNWQEMTEEQKNISDKKSLEIFGVTNKKHNFDILREEKNKKIFLGTLGLIILIIGVIGWVIFASSYQTDKQESLCGIYEQRSLKIGEKIIKVDISDDDCKRVLGLSGRKELKNDTGMLFVFPKGGNHGFWMKDMNFPIDILWIDGDFNIIGIEKSVATSTYPEIIGGKYLAQYVLELFSGFSEKNNIKVGNKIIFSE